MSKLLSPTPMGQNLGFALPKTQFSWGWTLMRAECVGKTKAQKKHSENTQLINYNPPILPLSPSKSRADLCIGLTPQKKLEPAPLCPLGLGPLVDGYGMYE